MKMTRKANPWARVIADKMKDSPDGVARLDVCKKDLDALLEYLSAENAARRIHSHSTTGRDLPRMKGAFTRVAVYPAGWKNNAAPTHSRRFESEAEAVRYLQEQRRKGQAVRLVNELGQYLDDIFASIDNPDRVKKLSSKARKVSRDSWLVETWEPGQLLKNQSGDFSEAELIGAAMNGISVARRSRWQREDNQPKATEASVKKTAYCSWADIVADFTAYKGNCYSAAELKISRKRGYAIASKLGDRIRRNTGMTPAKFFASLKKHPPIPPGMG